MHLVVCKWHYLSFKQFFSREFCIFENVGILSVIARHRHFSRFSIPAFYNFEYIELNLLAQHLVVMYKYRLKISQ